MKTRIWLVGLTAAWAATALAQGMGGMGGMGPGMGGMMGHGMMMHDPAKMDCSKLANPERCEEAKKAMLACQDKAGAARQDCVDDAMPAPDCGKMPHPERCAYMQSARAACKGKSGLERRQCMDEQLKSMGMQ